MPRENKREKNTFKAFADVVALTFVCAFFSIGMFYFIFPTYGVNISLFLSGILTALAGMYLILLYRTSLKMDKRNGKD